MQIYRDIYNHAYKMHFTKLHYLSFDFRDIKESGDGWLLRDTGESGIFCMQTHTINQVPVNVHTYIPRQACNSGGPAKLRQALRQRQRLQT